MANKIVCCGGGNDENGMLWLISGQFSSEEDKRLGFAKAQDKYCSWYPYVNEKSKVVVGGGLPIPPAKNLGKGAMTEYKRLMKNSEKVYEKDGDKVWVTRRMLNQPSADGK